RALPQDRRRGAVDGGVRLAGCLLEDSHAIRALRLSGRRGLRAPRADAAVVLRGTRRAGLPAGGDAPGVLLRLPPGRAVLAGRISPDGAKPGPFPAPYPGGNSGENRLPYCVRATVHAGTPRAARPGLRPGRFALRRALRSGVCPDGRRDIRAAVLRKNETSLLQPRGKTVTIERLIPARRGSYYSADDLNLIG